MKILVVEDFGPVRGAVVTALRDEGWAVDIAADGNTALEKVRAGGFDLVVLDIMLPGVDGIQVLERMRAEGNDAHVLVVTARDQVSDRVAALNGGADDYLTKPFAIEELIARAHALLRRKFERKSPVISVGPLEVRATEHRVLMGQELTEEDDFGYSFFLVLSGSVKVTVAGAVVATLSAGDHFGEKALVSGERRNATVTATETCRLAKMMTWDFNELLAQHPSLARRLEEVAADREN